MNPTARSRLLAVRAAVATMEPDHAEQTLQTDQRIILIGSAEALPRQATSYKRAFYCFFSERYAG